MKRVTSRIAPVLVVTALAASLAGCGGGTTTGGSAVPASHAVGAPAAQAAPMPQDDDQAADAQLTAATNDADRTAADAETDLADPDG